MLEKICKVNFIWYGAFKIYSLRELNCIKQRIIITAAPLAGQLVMYTLLCSTVSCPAWRKNVHIFFFCPPFWSPGKKAPAGSGGLPGGQSDQFPGSRHHHAGGAAALDVP